MNTAALRKMMVVAALTGLVAGVLLTLIQHAQVVPLILAVEFYEQAAETAMQTSRIPAAAEHEPREWQPTAGRQRNLFTAAANIVCAFGFALLLVAVITLRRATPDWRTGLLWGLSGYAVFFVAPSFGLPPEVPGTSAAELTDRQIWWATASFFTAIGLACILFSKRRTVNFLGVMVLFIPHLIGAPQPDIHHTTAPPELTQAFIAATAITNAVFWLSLGSLLGFFHHKVTT